jgi:predicted O-linked N-acetylglucosamine transferase (SPINDLY family)
VPFDGQRRLRIGYHCASFDSAIVRHGVLPFLRAHDRRRVEVVGYAGGLPASSTPPALPFDALRLVQGLDDEAFRQLVHQDGIDVLIELSGFSPGHRFAAMARRCAPVQVSFLGHFGTSGTPNVDFLLSDEVCTPFSEGQQYFSEKIFRLPGSMFCFDSSWSQQAAAGANPTRPKGRSILFGCLADGDRIDTDLIGTWATLLHRVPGSRLLIANDQLQTPDNRRFMVDRFRRHGISGDRLDLKQTDGPPADSDLFFNVDIVLDTIPYSSVEMVARAVSLGLPAVTCRGTRYAGRTASSLLLAMGRSDAVASSVGEYLALASRLASNPDQAQSLRPQLHQLSRGCSVFDASRFARSLEDAYLKMMATRASQSSETGWPPGTSGEQSGGPAYSGVASGIP